MIENVDYVICPICLKKKKFLTNHIKIHNLSKKDFKEKYPNNLMICKKSADKKLGKNNPMYGKISANKGNKYSLESRNKMSNNKLGNKNPAKKTEVKEKLRQANLGKKHTAETKKKLRQITVERIMLNNGRWPGYSTKAVKYFKQYDKKNNTNGQYATNPQEFYIKELGYWVDYINFDKKIIMEWDEPRHKFQKEKDLIRQNEIQQMFPHFNFIRITEAPRSVRILSKGKFVNFIRYNGYEVLDENKKLVIVIPIINNLVGIRYEYIPPYMYFDFCEKNAPWERNWYTVISGGVETNETNDEAIYRELQEETGLFISDKDLVKNVLIADDIPLCKSTTLRASIYLLQINETNVHISKPSGDGTEFERKSKTLWVNKTELEQIIKKKNCDLLLNYANLYLKMEAIWK